MICKRILDELGKINASQQTAAAGRQGLLCAGIYARIREFLCIAQKVPSLDTIPEQCSRFRVIPVCLCDPAEKITGIYCFLDDLSCSLSRIMEQIILVILHSLHEILMNTH